MWLLEFPKESKERFRCPHGCGDQRARTFDGQRRPEPRIEFRGGEWRPRYARVNPIGVVALVCGDGYVFPVDEIKLTGRVTWSTRYLQRVAFIEVAWRGARFWWNAWWLHELLWPAVRRNETMRVLRSREAAIMAVAAAGAR